MAFRQTGWQPFWTFLERLGLFPTTIGNLRRFFHELPIIALNRIFDILLHVGKPNDGNPLRKAKNISLVCTTLFSRAAIEGGLNPELALPLTDYYFQKAEACTNISDLNEITRPMQEDFIQRVHRHRTDTMSKAILECYDYILLHLEDELTLTVLFCHGIQTRIRRHAQAVARVA